MSIKSDYVVYTKTIWSTRYWFKGGIVVASDLKSNEKPTDLMAHIVCLVDLNTLKDEYNDGYPDVVYGYNRVFYIYRCKFFDIVKRTLGSTIKYLESDHHIDEFNAVTEYDFKVFGSPVEQKNLYHKILFYYGDNGISMISNKNDLFTDAYIRASGYYEGNIHMPTANDIFAVWNKLRKRRTYMTRDGKIHYKYE